MSIFVTSTCLKPVSMYIHTMKRWTGLLSNNQYGNECWNVQAGTSHGVPTLHKPLQFFREGTPYTKAHMSTISQLKKYLFIQPPFLSTLLTTDHCFDPQHSMIKTHKEQIRAFLGSLKSIRYLPSTFSYNHHQSAYRGKFGAKNGIIRQFQPLVCCSRSLWKRRIRMT